MRLALKELLYNWKKYLLIELITILLMFMVLFLSGMANGLGRAVSAAIEEIDATYFLISDSSEDLITVSNLDVEVLETLKEQTTSELATLNIQRMFIEAKDEDDKENITYFAIDKESFLDPEVFEGVNLTNSDVSNPIVLDDDFQAHGIVLGDVIVDSATDMEFTVVGFAKDQMYGHTSVGFITTESFTELRTILNPMYQQTYNTIVIKSDDISSIDIDDAQLDDKDTIIKNLPSYQAEQTTITMIVWVLVVVSAMIIGIFNYILTLQKEKQFGVMKAIGFSMAKITNIIVCQVGLSACFGVAVAIALTYGMSAGLPQTMPYYLANMSIVLDSAVFVLISVISSLLSVIKVSAIDPIKSIGGAE